MLYLRQAELKDCWEGLTELELQVKGLLYPLWLGYNFTASAYSPHSHRVFIETPPHPPLCPCQRKGETSPWWVHLWSLRGASAPPPFFHPSPPLCWGAVRSSEGSVCPLGSLISPGRVSGLFHPHAQHFAERRLESRKDPASTQSLAPAGQPPPPSPSALQLIRVGSFFQSKHEGSFLTVNR